MGRERALSEGPQALRILSFNKRRRLWNGFMHRLETRFSELYNLKARNFGDFDATFQIGKAAVATRNWGRTVSEFINQENLCRGGRSEHLLDAILTPNQQLRNGRT
jgi:hypothetical protein